MFRKYMKLLYKLYLSQSNAFIPERAIFALLLIFELHYASVFIAGTESTSPFDFPILKAISLTNFLEVFGSRATANNRLLYFFTGLFTFLWLVELYWIYQSIKHGASSERAQKLSMVGNLIQKHVLMIPALMLSAENFLADSLTGPRIIAYFLICLVCGYNLMRAKYQVTLPYAKTFYPTSTLIEEILNLAMIVAAAFLTKMQANGSFSKSSVLVFSGVYLLINSLRITNSVLFPQLFDPKYQAAHILIRFLPFYSLLAHLLEQYLVSSRFPSLLMVSCLAKIAINCKETALDLLYGIFQKNKFSFFNRRIRTLALKSLYLNFLAIEKPNHEILRVVQAMLEHSSNKDAFDNSASLDVSEFPLKTYLKPKLLKFIEGEYAEIMAATNIDDSFQVKLSHMRFIAVACRNPVKAMLLLCETKKLMKGFLSTQQQAILEALQDSFQMEFKSEVSLNEVLSVHETYDVLLKRTENLVKTRAQLFTKIVEPACDLFTIKKLGLEFAHGIDDIAKEMRQLIKKDCIYMGILHLYEYVQTILFEKSIEFEISMLQDALFRAKNLIYADEATLDKKVLTNIDNDSPIIYMAFSLDRKNFGKGIVCSKNAQEILGTPENVLFNNLTIEDVFPKFFAQRLREVMLDYVDSGVGNYKDLWCKVWICQADGSICEARAFISVDLLNQSDLSIIVYVFPNKDSQNYILCDSNLNLIGLSTTLVEYVRNGASRNKVELLARIENAGIIQDIIPSFELALSTNKEFEGLIQFDKVLTLMTQKRSKSSVAEKKPSTIQPNKQELARMAKFTVSFERLDAFDIGFCKVVISQIDDRPIHYKKVSIASTRIPMITSADQHWDHKLSGFTLPLPLFEGPSKINPISCEVTVLDSPIELDKSMGEADKSIGEADKSMGEADKSEDADLRKEHYLDYCANEGEFASKTSHLIASKKREEILERNSSHSSSRLSIRRRRMKILISKLDVPNFLMVLNICGHLAVALLVVLAIISSVIINQGYNRFSQFAAVAPFPSYFISAVESIFGSMETLVSINRNFYPSDAVATDLQASIAVNFQQKIDRFTTAFDKYMVNFNVPSISQNFKWSDYNLNATGLEDGASGNTLPIYEVSRMFLAAAWKLSLSRFDQITTNTSEVVQFREYIENLLNTYENMRTTLFTGFYSQYDEIIRLFDMVVMIGVIVTMVLIAALVYAFRLIEKRKFELMKQLMTIPTNLIDSGLKRLQTDYELYFGVTIPIILAENNLIVAEQTKKKSRSSGNKSSTRQRKIIQTNETSLLAVSLWMLIPAIYVLSYYVIVNIYFKLKTGQTILFIKNIDILSQATHYPGYSLGLLTQLTNYYDSPESLEAQTVLAEEILTKYKQINTQMVEMMQSASATLLSSSEASSQLKERYLNISGIGACDDIIAYPNYEACLTAFQNAAELGFASTSQKLFEYVSAVQTKFLTNSSLETVLEIYADPIINDRTAISLQVDSTIIENMEIGTSNLSDIIGRLQWNLTIFMVVGIVQMSSLLFLLWRPFNNRITSQYLDCRRVFAILPIDMISDNKSIMYILKKQDNTQFGF